MSKPREIGWEYAKKVIRVYPALRKELQELREQSMSADTSGMPRGGAASRTTESIATRELSPVKQRQFDAVSNAIRKTMCCSNGRDKLRLIELVFWKNQYTLEGAAMKIPCSSATAKRWHGEFIRLVGKNLGVMEK